MATVSWVEYFYAFQTRRDGWNFPETDQPRPAHMS
jgi:hypothetical protein